jgi:glutathione S-transferase
MASEIILHHYALSPFSEKIRRILAYKKLAWRAVDQPLMAPKPDLAPLTGGYRRIPVLQIDADIYCDTALIVGVIERHRPAPAVLPSSQVGLIRIVEDWADHRLFLEQVVPPVLLDLLPALPPGFLDDRAAMSRGFTREHVEASAPHALNQLMQSLDRMEAQLMHQPFLLGAAFTVADAACFHPVWFMRNSPRVYAALNTRPALADWVARIEAFGPGSVTGLAAGAALDIARATAPVDIAGGCMPDTELRAGRTVTIKADDYGTEETTGRLVRLTASEVVVMRDDPRVGTVAVHYPRAGYRLVVHD